MESGEWLEKSLLDLGSRGSPGVELDPDLISGLVSFCELAPPPDAADYLKNIIGPEVGQQIINEYLQRRGWTAVVTATDAQPSNFQPYMKTKKQTDDKKQSENVESSSNSRAKTKKKKAGKAISLAEAAKGSVVFRKGDPCSCQARRHRLVSNCLSCGKIVCEQEGEGPCSFCGALVLKEGSTYAGLDELVGPVSDAEVKAEAYAKRLVDYDRNSAARTKVIDDQSDYYEFESNNWLSEEEKALLRKKQKEIEEADKARRGKVVVTFDLVGRKVILNKDDTLDSESENRILRTPGEREQNRIKPNPTINIQPVFVLGESTRDQNKDKGKKQRRVSNGLCLEISGRVQHDNQRMANSSEATASYGDEPECSLDYN